MLIPPAAAGRVTALVRQHAGVARSAAARKLNVRGRAVAG
jgi:hypothetical protein